MTMIYKVLSFPNDFLFNILLRKQLEAQIPFMNNILGDNFENVANRLQFDKFFFRSLTFKSYTNIEHTMFASTSNCASVVYFSTYFYVYISTSMAAHWHQSLPKLSVFVAGKEQTTRTPVLVQIFSKLYSRQLEKIMTSRRRGGGSVGPRRLIHPLLPNVRYLEPKCIHLLTDIARIDPTPKIMK